jgi:hypothetical protein
MAEPPPEPHMVERMCSRYSWRALSSEPSTSERYLRSSPASCRLLLAASFAASLRLARSSSSVCPSSSETRARNSGGVLAGDRMQVPYSWSVPICCHHTVIPSPSSSARTS